MKVTRRCGLIESLLDTMLFHGIEFIFKVCCLYTMFDAKQKFMQIRTCLYRTTCCGNSRLDTKISLIAPSIIVCFNIFSNFYIEATE